MTPPPPLPARSTHELQRAIAIFADELRDGCRDRKVSGGLERFVIYWLGQVRRTSGASAAATTADAVASLLAGYRELQPPERRARLEQVLAWLRGSGTPPPPASSESRRPATSAVSSPLSSRAAPGSVTPTWLDPFPAQTGAACCPSAADQPVAPRLSSKSAPPSIQYAMDTPIDQVRNVGAVRARLFYRLGIRVFGDLLQHLPNRHEAYPPAEPAAQLFVSPAASYAGVVRSVQESRLPRSLRRIAVDIGDETGTVSATWLRSGRGGFLPKVGDRIAVSGPLTGYGRHLVFENPAWEPDRGEPIHTRRLVPIYPLTAGLGESFIRSLAKQAVDAHALALPDPLPERWRQQYGLHSLGEAIQQMHFPADVESLAHARRRLALDELLLLQIVALRRRHAWQSALGRALSIPDAALEALEQAQPFRYTSAQRRVMAEIFADIARAVPMSRLLQGEVGSGKTAVAAAALLVATANGMQGALMAPTEILAEPHARGRRLAYERAVPLLSPIGLRAPRVELLVGSQTRRQRRPILNGIASGELDVVVGTQAVIQDSVEFRDLAVAVVDEQHRFGVKQRVTLRAKGANPHLLVMTATPIPRTLALCLHGDLDRSVIDELPPGRKPINTKLLMPLERHLAYEVIRLEVKRGRQAFIICPLVEGSDRLEARAATEEYERLSREDLAGLRLGLLHGRLKSAEKEAVMRSFAAGDLDVLVSTSVVEVGVDVPNATVMLVEGAERFGLAQLHQFRGRVGRGPSRAHCFLLTDQDDTGTLERLQAVADAGDGLALAELDLQQRGPGDFFGVRQSGLPELRVANLGDASLLLEARELAQSILREDPTLEAPDHALLATRLAALLARAGEPN
ncbi:MAG: ATP-dependent DNA helicase RecG [Chloroflexi bacterium]|nr:ATP-dependent DNA helicase RecG [Chloroflexota bacterium]